MNMKKKVILIGLVLLTFIFLLMLYSKWVFNSAIEECKSKYMEECSISHMKAYDNKKKDDPNYIKNILIDKFQSTSYDKFIMRETPRKGFVYLILASNKWNYGDASFDVFETLANLDSKNRFVEIPNLDFLDKETITMAIIYLKKASLNGPVNAKYILGKYYLEGKYVDKNEELGAKLLKEADKLSNGILK